MTPTTYGRDFAYCLKSHGGVRGFNASLWRFLLRCTLFCHSVATFLTSVSSYEGGCGFEVFKFQSFVHDFVIFSCLLFAFETIDHPLVRSPHHPADGVPETTGADVYPATGGEGSGFYPFYSRLNDGSSFFHTPILSFSKK